MIFIIIIIVKIFLSYFVSQVLYNYNTLIGSSLQKTFLDVYHFSSHFGDEETNKDLFFDFCEFKESFLYFIIYSIKVFVEFEREIKGILLKP